MRRPDYPPRHKWDGVIIKDSTVRDAYYQNVLEDNSIAPHREYYYGIFPYHVSLDDVSNQIKHYRYTKVIKVVTGEAETVQVLLKTSEAIVTDLVRDLINIRNSTTNPAWIVGDRDGTSPEWTDTLNNSSDPEIFCTLRNPFGKGEATKMYVDVEGVATRNAYATTHASIYCALTKVNIKDYSFSDCWDIYNNNSWVKYMFLDAPARTGLTRQRFEIPLDDVEGNFYISFEMSGLWGKYDDYHGGAIIREISFDAPVIVKGG